MARSCLWLIGMALFSSAVGCGGDESHPSATGEPGGGGEGGGGPSSSSASTGVTASSSQSSSSAEASSSASTGTGGTGAEAGQVDHVSLANGAWVLAPSEDTSALAHDVAVDPAGNALVTGVFCGQLDFGSGVIEAPCDSDSSAGFVAKIDPNGNALWTIELSGTGDVEPRSVAVDPSGDIVLAGTLSGTADFGAGSLTEYGGFVAKFAPDGTNLFLAAVDDVTSDARSVATDPQGNIVLAGNGSISIYVAKLDPSGAPLWINEYLSDDDEFAGSVATDGAGNVFFEGRYHGSIDLGLGPLPIKDPDVGAKWGFVLKLDSNGAPVFVVPLAGSYGDSANGGIGEALALDAGGNVYWTGTYSEPVEIGAFSLPHSDVYYYPTAFLAKIDPVGNVLWAEGLHSSVGSEGGGVAVAADGKVALAGAVLGGFGECGGIYPPQGMLGSFVGWFEPEGGCQSGTLIGYDGYVAPSAVAAGEATYVVGDWAGYATFGSKQLAGPYPDSYYDRVYVARFP